MKIKSISKVLLRGLMLVLLSASLVACGKPADTKDKDKSGTTAPTEKTDTPSENDEAGESDEVEPYTRKDYSSEAPLKVSFTGIAWGNGAEEGGVMEQAFEEMLNLDMEIAWVPYQDYQERTNIMMSAGNVTDVTQIFPVDGKTFYPQVAEAIDNDIFWDLTPFVLENGFKDQNKIMSQWPDQVWENCSYNGRLYALPRRSADPVPNAGILVRRDLMKQAGITEEPTTVEELGDFIIAMKEATGLFGLDFSIENFESDHVKQIAVAYTGIQDWGIDGNGDFYYQSFMDEYDDFLLWMKKLYDNGAIDPEFVLGQTQNSSFVGGKSTVKMHSWYVWNQSEDLVTKKYFEQHVEDTAEVWGMLPVKGPNGYTLNIGTGTGYDNPVMISKKVPKEDVQRIVDSICRDDDEYLFMLHNGLEGVHHSLEDDGVTFKPSTDEQAEAKKAGYVGGWNQILLDQDPDFIADKFIKAGSSEEVTERAKEISKLSKQYAKEMNISSPTLTLQSETYNNKWVNIVQDLNDNKALVVMGKMPIEKWREYVESIVESADYQAVISEFKEAKAAADAK